MEPHKTLHSQSSLEKKRTKLEVSHSLTKKYHNQGSMVLAQKQKHRSVEQNKELPIYGQLMYNKGGKNIQWGKEIGRASCRERV